MIMLASDTTASIQDPRNNNLVVAVEDHLEELHAIALRKLKEDPLPHGKEAEKRIRAEIQELDLEENVADLETNGYTILPPGKAAPIEFTERLRDTVLRLAENGKESGVAINHPVILHSVPRDPIFEEVLQARRPLCLVNYLLGYRAKLSLSSSVLKGRGAEGVMFHADHSTKIPPPWTVAQYSNISWLLTDYTRDNGAICVVPGSHRRGANPPDSFVNAQDHEDVEVIEVPAGSVIVFHGSLWHGSVPRKNKGERLTFLSLFCRDHIQSQEAYWVSTTPEMLERNPRRFATLMGLTSQYPWISAVNPELMSTIPRTIAQFD